MASPGGASNASSIGALALASAVVRALVLRAGQPASEVRAPAAGAKRCKSRRGRALQRQRLQQHNQQQQQQQQQETHSDVSETKSTISEMNPKIISSVHTFNRGVSGSGRRGG